MLCHGEENALLLKTVLKLEEFIELRVAHGKESEVLKAGDWYVNN